MYWKRAIEKSKIGKAFRIVGNNHAKEIIYKNKKGEVMYCYIRKAIKSELEGMIGWEPEEDNV